MSCVNRQPTVVSICVCCTARRHAKFLYFFFNDTATTEIYTLSLHDALPISERGGGYWVVAPFRAMEGFTVLVNRGRSEEHTSELQSHLNLVCRLLLEKKKNRDRHPSLMQQRFDPRYEYNLQQRYQVDRHNRQ